jgi:EAL domain-containing protein (putative c-di-GMP-specific phosphodiesterase class I)
MPERPRTTREPIDLRVELQRAVEKDEFGLEYQPIVDLQSGSIAAVEALLRWRHPLLGTIPPGDYLPIASETGLIVPIGERVIDAATRQLRTWHLGFARMQSLWVSVNVAPEQLASAGFRAAVETALERSDLAAGSLTLELGAGCSAHGEAIQGLRDFGVGLVLEDYGVGPTLDEVRQLPLTGVKLHPTFATMAAGSPDDSAFAEGLLALTRGRALTTIGKGVETRDQARRLAVMGVDLAQGFLYSKALGPEGIGTLLARGRVSFGPPRAR